MSEQKIPGKCVCGHNAGNHSDKNPWTGERMFTECDIETCPCTHYQEAASGAGSGA